jgi:hypothetical chaperone protein
MDAPQKSTGVDSRDVDRALLTGGISFVPAVRRIFTRRFGENRPKRCPNRTSAIARRPSIGRTSVRRILNGPRSS